MLYDEIRDIKTGQKDLFDISKRSEKNIAELTIYSRNHQKEIDTIKADCVEMKKEHLNLESTVREDEEAIKDVTHEHDICFKKHEKESDEKKTDKKESMKGFMGFVYASIGGIIVAVVSWLLSNYPKT
jgi:chromosome segregation ATPase